MTLCSKLNDSPSRLIVVLKKSENKSWGTLWDSSNLFLETNLLLLWPPAVFWSVFWSPPDLSNQKYKLIKKLPRSPGKSRRQFTMVNHQVQICPLIPPLFKWKQETASCLQGNPGYATNIIIYYLPYHSRYLELAIIFCYVEIWSLLFFALSSNFSKWLWALNSVNSGHNSYE